MKKKILVVDDNPLNLKLIKTILEVNGFNVIAKEDPEDVIKNLDNIDVDLVLLDIQMPKVDGVALFKILKENFKEKVPILALTAYAMKGDREKFLEIGFDDYIDKPIEVKEFLKKVEGYIER